MASIARDANGCKRIQFVSQDGSRPAIRLGKVTQRDAESFKIKLEALLSARLMGNAPDRETSLWLSTLGDDIHAKLVAHELVEPRHKTAVATLEVFVDQFIAGRTDMAQGTLIHYRQAKGLLIEYFEAGKVLADITPHDADQFRSWLNSKGKAENTTRGHLKNTKLFFGAAVKARLIVENPFKGISSQLVKRPDRMAFVDRATVQQVLDACPTTRWKAIVALCRFGGLRCPSELFTLRWADVDFDRGRMKVRSPKGENFGKGIREVPLFHEVRHVLDELFLEPDGGEFVIATNDRSSQKNLRTVFEKILRKAGVDPWPRLMQNLRSSRETELAREYPLQTVTAWLGNTPKVALENYLQVRDEDFTKAAQNPAQQQSATPEMPASSRNVSLATNETTPGFPGVAAHRKSLLHKTLPPLGLEPRT